jgi:hypothetical protein
MKKIALLIGIFSLLSMASQAQGRFGQRMEERKKEFITSRMQLPADKETEFWALVDEMDAAKKDIRIEIAQNRMSFNKSSLSDKESSQIIEKDFTLKKKMLDSEKSHYDRMARLVGYSQVVAYIKAEQDFNRLIINRIAEPRLREEH